ncbi:MAG: BREX-1 system adenine-specific DNA-methyltransferase PglX [Ruminococcus sp.]|nr:BREX-1 system adenine-specific DNA-methyltransferase PglX [Ruminococcus sp.]
MVPLVGYDWLYQYYNSEPKDKVFANLKKNVKISAADIPAATQLFTPDWIVRYMVENSLGRLWTEGHGKPENANWKYYLEEAKQEDAVKADLEKLRAAYREIQPEQIKIIDPCMGSGHILVYAFDVLMDIYTACGWSERDAAKSILRNNLYGLDIDRRAYQLAYFAVMMKARQYNRRILSAENQPNLANFADVMHINTSLLSGSLRKFAEQFQFADTYGSLMTVTKPAGLDEAVSAFLPTFGMQAEQLEMMMRVARILTQKYDVVCTNPPYMGGSGMNATLSTYVKKNFPDSKSDLFACFMEKCGKLIKRNGLYAMITQHAWMFLSSYEKLREKLKMHSIVDMAHLGARAFDEIGGEVVQTTAFVSCGRRVADFKGTYVRLVDIVGEWEKEAAYRSGNHRYTAKQENFSKIPGSPVAYWVSEKIFDLYINYPALGSIASPRKGNSTSNNDRFLRRWFEVNKQKMNLHCEKLTIETTLKKRWFPYNKGGGYRKWYGFNEYLIDWYNDAAEIRKIKTAVIANYQYFMKPGLTWSTLTSGNFSIRWFDEGFIFDNGGCCIFDLGNKRKYLCALLNSKVFAYIFSQLNPTLNFQSGEVAKFPIKYIKCEQVDNLAYENVQISKEEYDCFETSWDFERHPLV